MFPRLFSMSFDKVKTQLFSILLLSIFCTLFLGGGLAYSEDFTSSSYKVVDPVMDAGGFGSSPSFQLLGVMSQIANGPGLSANFGDNAGFLYFPTTTTPVAVATPGDGQITLSWTASVGTLGWTTSGYNIGRSTTSGGPYSYTSLGNVTSSVVGGLVNSTTYYFVVATKDAFGNVIVVSSEVSATPVAVSTPPGGGSSGGSGGGGGGGGGGGPSNNETKVIFTGKAYPQSIITLLKDAQVIATTRSDTGANFQITVASISGGNYIFSVYSEDNTGIRSSLLTFPVGVTSGVTTNVDNIFIAPTVAVDKSEVKRGDNIVIFGQSVAHSDIVISVHSDEEFFGKTVADKNGIYLYNFDTSFLEFGSHMTKSKASIGNQLLSGYSNSVSFTVGLKNVAATIATNKCPAKADLNSDCKVNLVDFSIAAYWYHREISPAFKVLEIEKLNGDGKVDLVDFSIIAYYWTG